MARAKRTVAAKPKFIRIDENVCAQTELLLLDFNTGKAKHGAFSALVENLLREWITTQHRGTNHEHK